MATTAGKIGKVQLGAVTIAEMDGWTYNPTADLIETTPFLATSKSRTVGLQDGSGTFKGRHDMGDASQLALRNAMLAGTQVTLRLYVNAANYYSGPALIKTTPVKSDVATVVEVQFDFQANGDWTYT